MIVQNTIEIFRFISYQIMQFFQYRNISNQFRGSKNRCSLFKKGVKNWLKWYL